MRHLVPAMGRADAVMLIDNSLDQGQRLVFASDHGRVTMRVSDPPDWLRLARVDVL